ncbi:MAG: hypothetical protein U9N30_11095 [Campylobacterota bacterium]|nr:hypothetical protein [Campylobacterota bacterium]
MNLNEFLEQLKPKCSQISYLSTHHILKKLYDLDTDTPTQDELNQHFENYTTYIRYLNDFAGPIYRRYHSSTEEIYKELCDVLNLSMDNKYLFEMAISKVEKQTASRIMQIEDDDFKVMTLEKFEGRLQEIKNTEYYQENTQTLENRIKDAQSQFNLVRKALNL